MASIDQPVGDDGDSAFGDFLATDRPEPQEEVIENYRDEAVRRALDKLPERERDVVELRFGVGRAEPTPLRETGRVLGMSAERVRQLEERALRQLAESGDLESLREAA
jgi:RNA polymerase primary sigma factor